MASKTFAVAEKDRYLLKFLRLQRRLASLPVAALYVLYPQLEIAGIADKDARDAATFLCYFCSSLLACACGVVYVSCSVCSRTSFLSIRTYSLTKKRKVQCSMHGCIHRICGEAC